ncbi:MAG: N-acetylmuramoyl-L-alanine amidase [Caldilineaceae bacterium]
MRRDLLGRIQKVFLLVSILLILVIGVLAAQDAGLPWATGESLAGLLPSAPKPPHIVLISGHKGNDSGAVCTDAAGTVTVEEADVNAAVAERVAGLLRQKGDEVDIFDEFDERLQGLMADVLVSLHADSCVAYSGYKAAHRDNAPSAADSLLLACMDERYPAATGLIYHPDTITQDMIDYHVFRKIDRSTPALILEMGFLGGDGHLLTEGADTVAQGVADGISCFLTASSPERTPAAP